MGSLTIVRPGMLTTVQDLGRWGYQALGVPVSGAMDHYSHRLANRLVGNGNTAATLEVTLVGPQITFDTPTTFAVTGAGFGLSLDRAPVEMNTAIPAHPGAVLVFGERVAGARAYLAVAGGVLVPKVLGSRATHVLSRMGGFEGRALRAGDRVPIGVPAPVHTPSALRPLLIPSGGVRVRVVPGSQSVFERLASQRFVISVRSDRMGYRLEGTPVGGEHPGELISHPVPMGALQVPPAGDPILLMADHATTGGYTVAATVISADLPLAGQLAPGDWIEFEACALADADRAWKEQEAVL